MLKSKGYSTGHFGKWHMGPKGYFPKQMGFDINIGGNEHGGPGSYLDAQEAIWTPRKPFGCPGDHLKPRKLFGSSFLVIKRRDAFVI